MLTTTDRPPQSCASPSRTLAAAGLLALGCLPGRALRGGLLALAALTSLLVSNPASAQTPPAPSISVAGGDFPHEIKVSWTWSAGDSGCTVDDYSVEYKKSTVATWNTGVLDDGANDVDAGVYSVDGSFGSSTSISSSFTIGPRAKGIYHSDGEGGVDLADVNYDVRLYAYSENCSDWTPNSNVATGKPTKDVAPAFAQGASVANLSLVQNAAMTAVTLPAATGGNGSVQYSISPDLPAGLSASQSTRVLSGTPTGIQAATEYTYKAYDTDYNRASTDEATLPTFTITVDADTAPAFADDAAIANLSLIQNTAMTEVTLPAASGGNGTLSYALSPDPPAGLSFTASTRVLSGTPTGTSASTTYTYTVSDGDNNTASTDADTLTFTVAVDATDIAPTVSFNPANGSTTTNASGDITLTFSEAVYKDASATEFGDNDLDALIELKVKDDNGTAIDFAASINAVNTVVTVNPSADLPDGDVYVEVGSGYYDVAGNQGSATSATFTVDTTAPTVVKASTGYYSDAAGTTAVTKAKDDDIVYIKITFSEDIGIGGDGTPNPFAMRYTDTDGNYVTEYDGFAWHSTLRTTSRCWSASSTSSNVIICRHKVGDTNPPSVADTWSGNIEFRIYGGSLEPVMRDMAGNTLTDAVTSGDNVEDYYHHGAYLAVDGAAPTVTSGGYYSDSSATTALSGTVSGGNDDIYTQLVFSEDLDHMAGSGASARPKIDYRIGGPSGTSTQYAIVASSANLASGQCQPTSSASTATYLCLYTTKYADHGDFDTVVGTATTDEVGHALASPYTTPGTLTFERTDPPPPPPTPPVPPSPPSGGPAPTPSEPEPPPLQGTLENPGPGSSQSGIGLLSGWVCDADQVALVLNPGTDEAQTLTAAYGTDRADTAAECGDRNNGFGLLFNWNLLGDGTHTLVARADGEVFGRATVTVTTLGEEFVREAAGECAVADFPDPGETTRLVWQEAQQNFVIAAGSRPTGPAQAGREGVGRLENPSVNSFQSGVGLISGWVCDAERVAVRFNNGQAIPAAYGTERADTSSVCGDTDNGFGLLFNWNLLGDGEHAVEALADGVVFGRTRVRVTTLGEEFVRGAAGRCTAAGFPSPGESVTLRWQQSRQNFVITDVQ